MQERYLAAVDLGSSKLALSVAKVTGDNVQIVYYKERPSEGIRYSLVYNPKKASGPLREAIREAENELGIRILQVVLGYPRYNIHQESGSARLDRSNPNECISREEVEVLKSMALDVYPLIDDSNEEIYGAVAQSFTADDLIQQSEDDVVGATAVTLDGNFKVYVGTKKASRNLDIMMNFAEVAIAQKVFTPYTTAQAVLAEEEKENGVGLIEFGAGVTSLTIFQGGIMRYYTAIPFGARNITTDIKYECGFKESLAENIKLAYGACMPEKLQSLGEKTLRITDDETGQYDDLPVKYLSEIITCRMAEILDAILFSIQESGFAERLRNGLVITGGGAGMANLPALIKEKSGYNVRIGYPRARYFSAAGCSGITETGAAASVGLILEAKRYSYLNCTEEVEAEEPDSPAVVEELPPQEDGGGTADTAEEPDYGGTVFGNDSGMTKEDERARKAQLKREKEAQKALERERRRKEEAQRKAEKEHVTSMKITWIKDKVGSMLGRAFDDTLGQFYDNMTDNVD